MTDAPPDAPLLRAVDSRGIATLVFNRPEKSNSYNQALLDALLEEVTRLAPRTILYLSCDPTTLARDLGWLAERGFRTRSLAPFVMLPHTPHIEVLAVVEFQPQAP